MQFLNTILLAASALATLATAQNFVQFVNQDSTTRTIKFTPNSGLESIDPLTLEGGATQQQVFPQGWIGNFYSINEGAEDVPGILGEVRFNGFADATYFDVSSIVNPDDAEGIKMLYPFGESTRSAAVSGCAVAQGCSNQYNNPNDVATLSTPGNSLTCLIGNAPEKRKRTAVFGREFVTA